MKRGLQQSKSQTELLLHGVRSKLGLLLLRGTLVTMCMAVSAMGNSIPPFFVFPRVHMKDDFLIGAPLGSCGSANKSRWMTDKDFFLFLQHFVKHVRPSHSKPALLLLDNHASHMSVEGLRYAKENGIIVLSFPPYTSHRLQPLDLSVYGPLKHYVNGAIGAWLKNNPGKTMTSHHVPGIVKEALPSAITPRNIMAGFQKAGVAPYNRNIFSGEDFAPSSVSDRPFHNQTKVVEEVVEGITVTPLENLSAKDLEEAIEWPPAVDLEVNLISSSPISPQTSMDGSVLEVLRPLPKAGPRNASVRNSRQRKTAILTNTPVKDLIEKEKEKSREKATKKLFFQSKKAVAKIATKQPSVKKRNTTMKDSKMGEKEWFCLVCQKPYSKSKSSWIECDKCKEWAHEDCVDEASVTGKFYSCDDCIISRTNI